MLGQEGCNKVGFMEDGSLRGLCKDLSRGQGYKKR